MSSIFRQQATTRLRPDDLLTKVIGGESQIITAEFWEAEGGAATTAVTVAQAQAKQQQDGDAATVTPVAAAQAQDSQQQDADAFTGIAAAVAQEQKRQEQDVDAEARDPLPSTDVTVAQDQVAQEQSAQAEAPTPPAASYGGGYYSTRVLPDTQRRREIKKARAKKPHGLTWPEKWPETTPEILPPLQVSIDCAVDQKQARQEQKILIKTAQGWEPFDYQPEAFKPEAIRLQPPPAPRRAPAWPAASSPIRRPAPVTRAIRKGPGGVSSKRESEEEELLVIIAASD